MIKNRTWDSHTGSDHPLPKDILVSDLDLYIIDPSGMVVAYSDSYDNSYEIVEFESRTTGTYKAKINRFGGNATYEYVHIPIYKEELSMKFKFYILLFTVIIVTYTGCVEESPKEISEQRMPSYEETQNLFTPREIITENETRKYISTVWKKIKYSEETKFVTSEKSYSAIVFIHPYNWGYFDNSTMEWVVIVSSIPETEKDVKIAIFRLDYETYALTKAYNLSYPISKEPTLEESIVIMEEEKKKAFDVSRSVNKENVMFLNGNYIYIVPKEEAGEFSGTIILNRYVGKVIYYATTIWDGKGNLVIPEVAVLPYHADNEN